MENLRLLRFPDIRLLWVGQVFSSLSYRLYAMAILWLALKVSGSAAGMSATALLENLPLIAMGIFGGVLVDRWDRLRTLAWLDGLRMVLVLSIPVAIFFQSLRLWDILLLAVLMGLVGAGFTPTMQAILPDLVRAEDLEPTVGLMDATTRLARVAGPGLAGVLLASGTYAVVFAGDAAGYAFSAVSILILIKTITLPPRRSPLVLPYWDHLKTGWAVVRTDRHLQTLLAVNMGGEAAFATFTLGAALLSAHIFQTRAAGYGALIGSYGVGNLIGNVLAGNTAPWRDHRLLVAVGAWIGIGAGFIGVGVAPGIEAALGAILLAGVFAAWAQIARVTWVGRNVRRDMLGHIFNMLNASDLVSASLGFGLTGILLTRVSAATLIAGAGVLMVVGAFVAIRCV